MINQRIENRAPGGIRGLLLVLLIALAVVLGSVVCSWLSGIVGGAASIIFIVYGFVLGFFVLDRYVLGYAYALENGCLRVSRTYGKRDRPSLEIWLSGAIASGSLEAMKARFPNARVHRAVKRECPIEPLAVAYNEAGQTAIALLQPNDALREAISKAIKQHKYY